MQLHKEATVAKSEVVYYPLEGVTRFADVDPARLPFSLRIILENLLRGISVHDYSTSSLDIFATWLAGDGKATSKEVPYMPARVLLQDFTGVPVMVDLALIREEVSKRGLDPAIVNPVVPTDLVVDHSVQVDKFGSPEAMRANIDMEYSRNGERYQFLKWAQGAFQNLVIVPPGYGIVHQVNLEYLAKVVMKSQSGLGNEIFMDTCVGADSHTTMVSSLSVLAWGVGGIEAEAVMLGQPYFMPVPEVVGVNLYNELPAGATATDLVLRVTKLLREFNVVGKTVEFFGEGLKNLTLPDRATLSNMAPEYGATTGLFPIDEQTISYLERTGRDRAHCDLVREYAQMNHFWYSPEAKPPVYSHTLEFDMASVKPSVAGPRRPQDVMALGEVTGNFRDNFPPRAGAAKPAKDKIADGSVAIAAITSCTNTSNPSVMVGVGLLAKNAKAAGLTRSEVVKSSLAPGSRVVSAYLEKSGLSEYLDYYGFHTVGYGCTTCIGNAGPLSSEMEQEITDKDIVAVAVLSGNRNFEGRIHPQIKANYLASPMLVLAYAIAGRIDIDFETEPLGMNGDKPVFLRDIWPDMADIASVMNETLTPDMFNEYYASVYEGEERWQELAGGGAKSYDWEQPSTYIKLPPYFDKSENGNGAHRNGATRDMLNVRVLAKLGDSVTTDHISPAGFIRPASPAGQYLREQGVKLAQFNSYGARRGNHEVMVRGTLGNVRLRNQLTPELEGDWTKDWSTGKDARIFDAAMKYQQDGVSTIILAGKEYGSGSSRDWAAKGPKLLGVVAVIAESYERIHRSNLIGMGVLPLQYEAGQNAASLGLTGEEQFHIRSLPEKFTEDAYAVVEAVRDDFKAEFKARICLDNEIEFSYYHQGGILPYILDKIVADNS